MEAKAAQIITNRVAIRERKNTKRIILLTRAKKAAMVRMRSRDTSMMVDTKSPASTNMTITSPPTTNQRRDPREANMAPRKDTKKDPKPPAIIINLLKTTTTKSINSTTTPTTKASIISTGRKTSSIRRRAETIRREENTIRDTVKVTRARRVSAIKDTLMMTTRDGRAVMVTIVITLTAKITARRAVLQEDMSTDLRPAAGAVEEEESTANNSSPHSFYNLANHVSLNLNLNKVL